jgi:hypothetical protein
MTPSPQTIVCFWLTSTAAQTLSTTNSLVIPTGRTSKLTLVNK